ncbi:integrase [Candidatus Methylomirabilis lanthanidiphila]|uniref:Integrase n=1 Tax=Candidatus Methylomirabilis lanthanidiphila TaxID=2211376 RepID=A0A564ZI24_9BACT|nr:integrase [Candidatus Methylomirabilis lanthanidiphila]
MFAGNRAAPALVASSTDEFRPSGQDYPVIPSGTRVPRTGSTMAMLRTVQERLGHTDGKSTMIYTHVLNRGGGVRSPADVKSRGTEIGCEPIVG